MLPFLAVGIRAQDKCLCILESIEPSDVLARLGQQPAGRAEFFRYEARLNEVIPNYPEVILCLYDLDRFGEPPVPAGQRVRPGGTVCRGRQRPKLAGSLRTRGMS